MWDYLKARYWHERVVIQPDDQFSFTYVQKPRRVAIALCATAVAATFVVTLWVAWLVLG